MTTRLRRLAVMAVVPTAVDIGLVVALRLGLGWILVLADVVAIAVASALSYGLHRTVTFRSDPFVRWVRMPAAFAAVAVVAGAVDVVVLRGLFAAHGFTTVWPIVGAKAVAVAAAATVRLVLYRAVLLTAVRRTIRDRSLRPAAPGALRASVVIPAFGEAGSVAGTIAAVREALAELDGGVEIIVVDDGSRDGTSDAAIAGGADQVITQPVNRGKGAAVRAGVAAARGRTVAFTDADLAYSPDQLVTVIVAIEEGWDVATGSRRHPEAVAVAGAGRLRDVGSRIINLASVGVLLSRPHDTQCGLKAFRSDVARVVFGLGRVDGFAFDIELLHLVERHELSLAEVPVRLATGDRSTVRAARDGLHLLRDIWRIRRWSAAGAYELPGGIEEALPSPGAASAHH